MNAGMELEWGGKIEQRLRNWDQGHWMWLKEEGRRISTDRRGSRASTQAKREVPKSRWAP